MNWKLSICAAAALACSAIAAHAEQATLRFGIEAAYPPFESKTPASCRVSTSTSATPCARSST
ncbi:hypothetical protein ACRS8P_21420 [Burkholderia cenocepacia]